MSFSVGTSFSSGVVATPTFSRLVRFVTAKGDTAWGDLQPMDVSPMSLSHGITRSKAAPPSKRGGYRVRQIIGSPFHSSFGFGDIVEPVKYLPPIQPTALYGVGLNYKKHAEEIAQHTQQKVKYPPFPVTFMKATQTVIASYENIILPSSTPPSFQWQQDTDSPASYDPCVDYEGELAVVLSQPCRNVSEKEAWKYVLGYTAANDITARHWQFGKLNESTAESPLLQHGQWHFSKNFDTFCPLGLALIHPEVIEHNPQNLLLKTSLNGETVQETSTGDMIFSVAQLISFLSWNNTLPAGTVILTGTPAGIGMKKTPPRFLKHNDQIEVWIEHIGSLINMVQKEKN